MIGKNDHTDAVFLLGKEGRNRHVHERTPQVQPVNPLQESSMFGTRKMIAAARTLHSSNVDELMEAFADDHRARSEPSTRLEIVSSAETSAEADRPATVALDQPRLPEKSAA
jgi:hypothetical protein